jgi:hypothetical protein
MEAVTNGVFAEFSRQIDELVQAQLSMEIEEYLDAYYGEGDRGNTGPPEEYLEGYLLRPKYSLARFHGITVDLAGIDDEVDLYILYRMIPPRLVLHETYIHRACAVGLLAQLDVAACQWYFAEIREILRSVQDRLGVGPVWCP